MVARLSKTDLEAKRLDVSLMWAGTFRYVFIIFALGVLLLCSYPVARVMAGRQTVINVSIALSLTAALSLVGFGALAWGRRQKKRADRLQERNDELSRQLKDLKKSKV